MRQLLTEGVVLALASVPLGLMLAVAGTRLIAAQIPPDDIPYYVQWRVDGRSLAYTIAVAVSTALVFGLVPALQTTRRELQESLKEGARGKHRRPRAGAKRAGRRAGLAGARGAGRRAALRPQLPQSRQLRAGLRHAVGADAALLHERRARIEPDRRQGCAASKTSCGASRRCRACRPRLPRTSFRSAAAAAAAEIEVEGRTIEEAQRPRISFLGVTPGVLPTLGVTVRRGRDFTESDASRDPSPSSTRPWPRRMWPNEDPIDRRFRLWSADGSREWLTVIGVAPDMQLFGIDPSNSQAPAAGVRALCATARRRTPA